MSLDLHRRVEALLDEAERAQRSGAQQDAARFFGEAARLEEQVFSLLPKDRPQTRSAIAISAVALYRDAGEFDRAVQVALACLQEDDLLPGAREELATLIKDANHAIRTDAAVDSKKSALPTGTPGDR